MNKRQRAKQAKRHEEEFAAWWDRNTLALVMSCRARIACGAAHYSDYCNVRMWELGKWGKVVTPIPANIHP